jgi:uncharacterized membrane protein
MNNSSTATTVADPRQVSYTHLMYALHAVSIVIGILSTAFIVTAFLFGLPSIIAVIMNYVRRSEVRGTWLESHFRWQLRSFWIALVALLVVRLVFGPLSWVWIGLPFLWLGYGIIGVWATYRVARGWTSLRDGRTMPNEGL